MDFDLYDSTALLCRSGSRLYGINNADSDIDVQGFAVPPLKYWLTNATFEQSNDNAILQDNRFISLFREDEKEIILNTKLEGTVYSAKKYVRLASESNPNVLDSIWAPDSAVLKTTIFGESLRANRGLFLSLSAYSRFVGYSIGQLKKMNLHRRYLINPRLTPPERADYNLLSPHSYSKDEIDAVRAAVKKQVDSWEPSFTNEMSQVDIITIKEHFEQSREEMSIASDDKYVLAERRLGIPTSLQEYFAVERKYLEDVKQYKMYQTWLRDRNPTRAAQEEKAGYDTKFAVHLIRLLRGCVGILKEGKYDVDRTNIDANLLREIRRGGFSYEDIMTMSEALQAEAKQAAKDNVTNLPARPQTDKIEELLQELVCEHFGISV